jgi:fido (protein-threonine AMPylation protein)
VARRSRKTLPVATLQGLITTYAELEPLLTKAELRGRGWILEKLAVARRAELSILDRCPDEYDLLALHREMFSEIFEWAGETRQTETVPGVYPCEIRLELRKLFEDLKERLRHVGDDPNLKVVAEIVADVHRRFEWIHPFRDTNGRTGRVFDHYAPISREVTPSATGSSGLPRLAPA